MKIAFFGTGEFSKNILNSILETGKIDVVLAVSQQDKPVGRKQILEETPVKKLSLEKNIKVLQPEKLRNNIEFFETLKNLDLDFIVVVAYGKIVPNEVLTAAKYGAINIHGSILPNYRGASPIQESIKNGDTKTGLTIMYMSQGMDEGDILAIKEINIDILDKTEDIFKKFENIGTELLIDTLNKIVSGELKGVKQDSNLATYCSKIEKKDGEINFREKTAKQIYDMFRAYSSWPGIYSYYDGKKISFEDCFYYDIDLDNDDELKIGDVIEIEDEHNPKNKEIGVICKKGILIIKQIKLEGKKTMDINTFINGNKNLTSYSFN
ncbi:MAG: methionyl-tRNA formyltransferase [Candidatus Gracilibacteria bacterium]|nr:methionyl-tRNA formyltransferase [Candidatus Gracilibacteria bacterium]